MPDLFWKCHANPFKRFFRNVAKEQTNKQKSIQTDKDKNITFAVRRK